MMEEIWSGVFLVSMGLNVLTLAKFIGGRM